MSSDWFQRCHIDYSMGLFHVKVTFIVSVTKTPSELYK